ncbi:MAG: hypothetical protein ACFFG0_18140 [Candidatus Thorarchaeota archaeon]
MSISDLKKKIDGFNRTLDKMGQDIKIELGQRYNYKALDLYRKSDDSMLTTIKTRLTTGQAWDYIDTMEQGIHLTTYSRYKKK